MTHRRAHAPRTLPVLLVVAVLVSILGAAPAVAVVDTSFSCPGTIEPAGFADVAQHDATTRRAIDCLATHGITHGTSPTTFNPSGTVPRWQMALFLVRQADAHGMTIPAAVDQGFTDLAGLSTEAKTAVNQLAQLGITLGTGPDTFSPYDNVSRWQMALFIVRLLAASGVTVPTAVDQGFGDLEGLAPQAQDAIDQLAMLGVANGTSATTFSPSAETLRWQMALFLTRALAVGGVLPPGTTPIDVSPAGHLFLDYQGSVVSRQYVVAVGMEGPFTIELWPASAVRTNGTFEAATAGGVANCDITLVDGAATSADKVTGIEPSGTTLTFSVGCTGLQDQILPVVYTGTSLEGIAGASNSEPKAPTNDAVGYGGGVTVVQEAITGAFGPVNVDLVDKSSGWFVSGGVTYFWDSNDRFYVDGVEVTLTEWLAALTSGDTLQDGSSYSSDSGGVSEFYLGDTLPAAPTFSLASVTATSATFTYSTGAGADHLKVYSCAGTGCETTLVRQVVAGTDEDPDTAGTQIVIGSLSPNTDYDFQAAQVEDGTESEKSAAVDVDTPIQFSITGVEVFDTNDGSSGWQYLYVTFDADIVVDGSATTSDFVIHPASNPAVTYSVTSIPGVTFGTTNELTLEFEFRNDTDPDTDWVLTIAEGALDVGAGADPNPTVTFGFSH
ncbi:MAG: S-layer homology domain-containing protein [Acidimicrobiia bacterium]|nr:S-layer homology domain-containing protein [Acidimicrobiia bacterium]